MLKKGKRIAIQRSNDQQFLTSTIALSANFYRRNDHHGMDHQDQFYSGLFIVAGELGG